MSTTATPAATTPDAAHATATAAGDATAAVAGGGVVRPLFALTDEELAVLAGTDQGVVAMPHLEVLDGELRSVALHTAYRSMLASGLVTLPTAQGAPPPRGSTGPDPTGAPADRPGAADGRWFPVELPSEVDAVLVLRGAAPLLLCLQRHTGDEHGAAGAAAGEQVLRYVHLVEDVALVEDVLATGLHRFGTVARVELGACVQ